MQYDCTRRWKWIAQPCCTDEPRRLPTFLPMNARISLHLPRVTSGAHDLCAAIFCALHQRGVGVVFYFERATWQKGLRGKHLLIMPFIGSNNMIERSATQRTAWLFGLFMAWHFQPSTAHAQDFEPGAPEDRAGARSQPEYDPLGIRLGTVVIHPRLSFSSTYDTNVFAAPDNEQSDFYYTVTPAIRSAAGPDCAAPLTRPKLLSR